MPSFALHQRHPSAQSEHWPSAASSAQAIKAEAGQSQPGPHSSSAWKAQWLELRIHALQQQQQAYEVKLQHLCLQEQGSAASFHPPEHLQSHAQASSPAAQPVSAHGASNFGPAQAQLAASQLAGQFLAPPQQPQKRPVCNSQTAEPVRRRRRARWPVPGLSVAELDKHPFFGHAVPSSSGQLALQGIQ